MNITPAVLLLSLLFAFASTVQARVFNFKDAQLAAYLRGTGGLSAVGQEPFGNSSGTDTSIDDETKFNYSGELGVMMAFSQNLHFRLGAEVIQHRPVKEAKGLNASGSERFELESSVFIFNPNATIEYVYSEAGTLRFFTGLGFGLADITVDNRYTMTTAGTTELGVGDFTEKMSASTTSAHFYLGLETQFVDNTTLLLETGYRYMPVKELKYKSDSTPIVDPSGVSKGDVVYNHDGSKRTMDLGGVFVGIGFRWYLHFL